MGLWILVALVARGEYVRSFRRSLDTREIEAATVRFDVAEASTIHALVDELSSPDEASVLYAIDMLETLDEKDRITPLLLHHASPTVRARALACVVESPAHADQWLPSTLRLLTDPDAGVRAAAVRAQAVLRGEEAATMLRSYLDDAETRVVVTAAAELADSGRAEDERAAEAALSRLTENARDEAAPGRRDAAEALARIRNPAFRSLLIPLIHDQDLNVAQAAIASARAVGPSDALFMPALVSRLGHRVLKAAARETLVSYGDDVIEFLSHVLKDREEYVWVRRHVPATLARIPSQRSMDALFAGLDEPDGFLRYKLVEAIGALRQQHPRLSFSSEAVERLVVRETARYYSYLTLRYNLVQEKERDQQSLLVDALDDKLEWTLDRTFRLLGLLHPWKDIAAARRAIEHGGPRTRAGALEYLDNVLGAAIRRRVMPILDEAPLDEKVRHANSVLKSRPRDVNDTLAQLIHEDDSVVAASAVHFAQRHRRVDAVQDDLEYVLARRSADRLVHDAARWALDSSERSEPRHTGDGSLPVVDLADRLHAIPLFAFVSVDELFRVAGAAQQVRHPRNADLYQQGTPASEVLFLLEGSARVAGGDPAPAVITAPAALNFADMLAGRPLRYTVRAVEPVVGLTIGASDFLTMLSDNILTAQGLFRMLLASPAAFDSALVRERAGAPAVAAGRSPDSELDAVEKARLLRRNPLFSQATVEQLKDLVAVTRATKLKSGDVLLGGDKPPAMFYILQGEVRVDADGAPADSLGPGSTVGLVETLTSGWTERQVVVTRDGHGLKLDHDALFEVLADHSDLLQGVFGGVLGVTSVDMKTGGLVDRGRDR
jgi:CRP-like cAMP-binding protein/HEAT repeat protein